MSERAEETGEIERNVRGLDQEADPILVDRWRLFAPLHGPDCGCIQCVLKRTGETEEERTNREMVAKTVTVANATVRWWDEPNTKPTMYVGVGIPRTQMQERLNSWEVVEAAVRVMEKEPGEIGEIHGVDLMNLFRQGWLIGYSEAEGVYLVGRVGQLLAAGVKLPHKTMVGRDPDHFVDLDIIHRGGNSTMPKGKKENANGGTTATAEKPAPKAKTESQCACGCGLMTGSDFAMGHDSKLRGQIHRVLEGKENPDRIPQIAYDRKGTITVARFNGTDLEDCDVPDAHFNHNKGVEANKAYGEMMARKAKVEAEREAANQAKAAEKASKASQKEAAEDAADGATSPSDEELAAIERESAQPVG